MRKTIEHLRKKERHEKEKIAFVGAIVITGLIVMFYLAGITALNSPSKEQVANTQGPIESIKGQFSDLYKNFNN